MAVNVGSASVTIMPSMNGFSAKMDKLLGSAGKSGSSAFSKSFGKGADPAKSGLLSRFRSSGSKAGQEFGSAAASGISGRAAALAGAVGGIASSLAGSLVGAVSGLAGEMAAASDSTQKFKSTLDFAGLDTSAIDALTKSTQDYADKTVYELGDVRNITAQLAANGVKDYDRLAQAAGNLNAVAGGTADTYKSVGMVLTQTAGQGKLTTENWNQLADAIPGASGKIQQALLEAGAYTGNFRDAMEKGEISAQEFNDAIMSLGFQDAAVQAAESTATFEGAMGNLEAAAVGAGSGIMDAFKPFATGFLSGAAETVTNLGNGVQDFLQKAQDNGAAQMLLDIVGKLGGAASDAGAGIMSLAGGLLGVDAGADPAATAADMLKAALEAAQPVVQGVADAAAWLKDNAAQAAPVVTGLAIAFAGFRVAKGIGGFVSAFSTALGGVSAAAGPASTAIGSVGGASAASAPQILAMGAAVLMVGGGVALAAAGLYLLAQGAIQIAAAGPGAAVAMVAMVAGIAGLAAGAAAVGPALTAGAVGLLAFGAAVLMIGAGIGVASAGIALLAGQLPTIAASGGSAAAAMAQIAAGGAAMGAGLLVAGAGVTVLAAGLALAAVGVVAFSVGIAAAALAATAAAAGFALLGAAIDLMAGGITTAAEGVGTMGRYMPKIASSAPGAATGLTAFAAAAAAAALGINAAAPALQAYSQSVAQAATGALSLASSTALMGAGLMLVAASAPSAATGLSAMAAAAMEAAPSLAAAAPSLVSAGSAATAAGAGFTVAGTGASVMAAGFVAALAASVALIASLAGIPAVSSAGGASLQTLAQSAQQAGQQAVAAIKSACAQMQSTVSSLRLRLPRIEVGPLPHFRMSGGFNAATGAVPSVSVAWYAKGGIFSSPSVIGVGEGAHDEAVVPLSKRVLSRIGAGIARESGSGIRETGNSAVNITIDGIGTTARVQSIVLNLLDELERVGAI